MRQLHAIVRGRVQGVSFRYYTQQQAQQLKLTGWVRNLRDGTVETVAVGPEEMLEQFLIWLRHGPSNARVTDVDVEWSEVPPVQEPSTSFEIRHGTE